MASEQARTIFENIMRKKPRQVREDFNEAIGTPVSELLEQEKRVIAESLFMGENNGETTPNDESDPAGYRKDTGNEWGEGHWDSESEKSNSPKKMQAEENLGADGKESNPDADKPFSLSKLRKSKEKDRFNKDMSSDGYDKKKSDENLGA